MPNDKKHKAESANEGAKIGHRAEAILQASIDGFCIIDNSGRILEVNSAYCDIIGYSKEELIGKQVGDIEANETAEQTKQHIEKVMN